MRYLIRLDNPGRYSPADRGRLSRTAYEAVCKLEADAGNLRVGSLAVELDLLLADEKNLQSAISALENSIGRLLTLRKLDVQPDPLGIAEAVRLGVDLFNEERYWESHEALESAWRTAIDVEKEILHALILIAASLVHLQKNEPQVTLSIMKRASLILSGEQGSYKGIDLDQLRANVNYMVTRNAPAFFKIPVA
jgi:hypothetical protein